MKRVKECLWGGRGSGVKGSRGSGRLQIKGGLRVVGFQGENGV